MNMGIDSKLGHKHKHKQAVNISYIAWTQTTNLEQRAISGSHRKDCVNMVALHPHRLGIIASTQKVTNELQLDLDIRG